MSFQRLIRFVADNGKTYFGNLSKYTPTREIAGSRAEILDGDIKSGFTKTGTEAVVSKVNSTSNLDATMQELKTDHK